MRGLNRVTLIGNLGNVPEFQTLEGGVSVAKFSLATNETFKDKNGKTRTETEWHNIVLWRSLADLWRSLADLARDYLQKGSLVYIEGKIKTRSYETKEGDKRYVTEIITPIYRQRFGLKTEPVDKEVLLHIQEVNRPTLLRFIETLELKAYSPSTIRTYRNEFAQFLYILKNKPATDLSPERLRDYFLYCTNTLKLSENTIHSRMNAVKFYRYGDPV